MCPTCAKQIETFQTFRFETIANQQFLKAWTAYRFGADTVPLTKLLRDQTKFHPTIRKTLHRLKVIESEDAPLEDLITDSRLDPEIIEKVEVKVEPEDIENPLLGPRCDRNGDEDISVEYEEQDDDNVEQLPDELLLEQDNSLEDVLSKKRKRSFDRVKIVDGVRTRPCYLDNCEPVPVGQADRHTRENHRAYCRFCGLVFLTYAQAVHHLAIHKNDKDRLRCEVCEKPFWREFDLNLHMREFHGIDVPTHECPVCGERFGKKIDLLEHRATHTKCKFCAKKFKTYRTMLDHMKKEHREGLIPCDICKTVFLGSRELEMHARRHRDGRMENSIQFSLKNWTVAQCNTCERDFYNHEYRRIHIENDHKEGLSEKPIRITNYKRRTEEELARLEYTFQCDDCPARFRLKTSLKGHWRKNHSGQKFICEHCGACFKGRTEMNRHAQYMHTKDTPFSCEFCDKRCITKNDLKIHRRSHTNEKPYKCWFEGCDKAYKTRSEVTTHFRVHTGERPYKCAYEGCDKSYSYSQQLKIHNRYHTLEKPFKCWYCELYFNSTNNRRKHCRRHHVGMPIGRELERLNQQPNATGSSVNEEPMEVAESSEESRVVEPVKIEMKD
ncbi:zinc finger protein ZFP2-like isoform X2 [Ochlerotatus camptorhynchus]